MQRANKTFYMVQLEKNKNIDADGNKNFYLTDFGEVRNTRVESVLLSHSPHFPFDSRLPAVSLYLSQDQLIIQGHFRRTVNMNFVLILRCYNE